MTSIAATDDISDASIIRINELTNIMEKTDEKITERKNEILELQNQIKLVSDKDRVFRQLYKRFLIFEKISFVKKSQFLVKNLNLLTKS